MDRENYFEKARADTAEATALVLELEEHLAQHYPVESRHGYSVEKLLEQGVHFFVVRVDGEPAGCGGVQLMDDKYGELKRMYVRPRFRGLGLGKKLLDHLADYTQQHGVDVLRLETGIHQKAAIKLYEGFGFEQIAPFGPYFEDPVSRCYEKHL